ncbi:MAG: PadR family transcriptional regulator [Solirubrobacterales bacterium]|nr:PadR family transcriptional regulator [Solirubrobacterales bacterium]MBV9165101.1 PadR family transcriptional regulator [Solirubrobacterales bacterium]MBV9535274.1 PadR family transcriptional regulator [Solirubrobacterales bacterium]
MPDSTSTGKLTTTEHALLGMLARYGEHSGYELLKLAESGIGFFWSPAKSHVYDVLPRLEHGGHTRRRVVRQQGRPDKQLWRITARGRAVLAAWLNTIDPDPFDARGVFLLKLFFGDHGSASSVVEHVERFRDQAAAKLATLQAIDKQAPHAARDELPRMTLREGLTVVEAYLRWAEEVLPELRARAGHTVVSGQFRPRGDVASSVPQ